MSFDIPTLESFLFSEKTDDFLKKLIQGTDAYFNYTLTFALNKQGVNLTQDQKKLLDDHKQNPSKHKDMFGIHIRYLLLKLQTAKTEAEQKQAISDISSRYLSYSFGHQQPVNVTGNINTQEVSYFAQNSSSLNQEIISIDKYLSHHYISQLDEHLLAKLNLETLIQAGDNQIRSYLQSIKQSICLAKGVPQFLSKIFEKNVGYMNDIIANLSLVQMKELVELKPQILMNGQFLILYILKTFNLDNRTADKLSGLQTAEKFKMKKEIITKIREWVSKLPLKFQSLEDYFLKALLLLDMSMNIYDFDLFVDFLKEPTVSYANFSSTWKQRFNQNQQYRHQQGNHLDHIDQLAQFLGLGNFNLTDDQIIKKYLHKYVLTYEKFDLFNQYFELQYLQKELAKVLLQKGKPVPDIQKYFNQESIQQLTDRKIIRINTLNKSIFRIGEEVKIDVQMKNIPQLTVKVFEFNTENYYRKNLREIDNNLELDGLIASEESFFEFSHPPILKFSQTFNFENIQGSTQGVFIIDFIGNGIQSRAIIKKGCLVLREKETIAGHVFQILDENLEICSGEKTGLFFQQKFYPVNSDKEVIIPYSDRFVSEKAIVIHNDFSQLADITIKSETYSFKCGFITNNETLLMSSKAKVLIQPRLYLNQFDAPLSLIEDSKIVVSSTNQMGISTSTTHGKIVFTEKNEIELELPVAAKTANIQITVEGNVKTMTQSKPFPVKTNHTITFNQHSSDDKFCIQNLRLTKNGYEIYLTGQNGEPKSGVTLDLQFLIRGYGSLISSTLVTNEEGFVSLHQLKDVVSVSSIVKVKGDINAEHRNWMIENKTIITYQPLITITTADSVVLPYLNDELGDDVVLIKTFEASDPHSNPINSVETPRLVLKDKQIHIDPLPEGEYRLHFRSLQQTVIISVEEGNYWKGSWSIQTSDGLICQRKPTKYLYISDIQIETPKEGQEGNTIKIQMNPNPCERTRAHVLLYTYLPENINETTLNLQSLVQKPVDAEIDTRSAQVGNTYQSNKILGDEIRYALDRKRHQRFIGNTLEKPRLLLKRNFVRDTRYDSEVVSAGGEFQAELGTGASLFKAPGAKHKKRMPSSSTTAHSRHSKAFRPPTSSRPNQIDSFNNYLLHPCIILANLRPNKDGLITIDNINLSKYSTIEVIASDCDNAVKRVEPLDKNDISKRNLSQRLNQQMDKFFTISRSNELIVKGSEFKSSDFTSTEIQLVDSIPKLFSTQKELRKIHGQDTSEQKTGYDFWDFLTKWAGYTLEEKHKKYYKFSCHELNLFIFCKDPPYFNDFVGPFIANKIEKSFIDRFLMGDTAYLEDQAKASSISQLNALELVLLVLYLKKAEKVEEAKGIFGYLESQNKIKKQDTQMFKKLFDTVLNAKTEAEGEGGAVLAGIHAAIHSNINNFSNANINNNNNNNNGGLFGARAALHSNMNVNMNMNMNNMPPQMMMQQQQAYPAQPMYMQQMQQQQQYMPQQMQMQMPMMQQQQQQQQQQYQVNRSVTSSNMMNQMDCFDPFYDQPSYGQVEKYGAKRGGFVKQYENFEKTKEYCERHYYSQMGLEPQLSRVPVNSFWIDLAKHIITHGQDRPFLSQNFIYCAQNHTQMISALSFLALPFESTSHNYEPYEGKGIKIIMSSNSIVFSKQIKEGQANLRDDILVSQKFFDPNDRYVFSDENPDDRYEKQITEYVIDKRYGCQVIVTNCSALKHELQVFVEIPSGSIPVQTNDYMKTHNITLEPFSTKPIEFFFYFPASGKQEIYPSNVSKSGQIVAVAKSATFDVKDKRTVSNLETMNEILQKGSKEDILNFIQTKNILNRNIFSFNEVYYLLRDKAFYTKFIQILKNRKVYDEVSWSYSIVHHDYPTFIELLNSEATQKHFKNLNLSYSNVASILDKNRFFEYSPLSNPRVHMLHQDKSNILNVEFREQYQNFLMYLSVKPEWSVADKLGIVYYFLLQDRIEEAINVFKGITEEQVKNSPNCQLQYDYFTSYLDFFIGFPNFKRARELCEKYLDYPILHWRNLFYEVANKLAEYDGEEEDLSSATNEKTDEEQAERKKKKNNKIKEELNEVLEVDLHKTQLDVSSQNISSLTVSYYLIDLEILFSRNPFLSKEKSDFSFVKPNHQEVISLDSSVQGLVKTKISIPEKFHKFNVCIELSTPNVSKSLTYFSTSLQVQAIQESGQVKVIDQEEKPLSKVYVKTFAKKKDGTVVFYKDGYTDLVGRFDYASRNSSDVSKIEKFSIFVMSDDLGALIKEVNPPSSVGQIVEEVKLKGAQWHQRADVRSKNQVNTYASHQAMQPSCKNAFY